MCACVYACLHAHPPRSQLIRSELTAAVIYPKLPLRLIFCRCARRPAGKTSERRGAAHREE